MEGKIVVMSVLLVSFLVLGQIEVEAIICCPTIAARDIFNACSAAGGSISVCASLSGCTSILGTKKCPKDKPYMEILENTAGDDAVNEYCKLGCVSSVCGAIATLQNSDASEIVNGAVEKCTDTCSAFCTKGAVQSA